MSPTLWTPAHLERLRPDPATTAPPVGPEDVARVLPHDDVWDPWPVVDADGRIVTIGGGEVWMALSAPARGHPDDRHDVARLRLLLRHGPAWTDCGHVFADAASAGSREWSGSAVRRADGSVSVFYTAAGRRGEPRRTFLQRVMEATGRLATAGAGVRFEPAGAHREVVRPADGYLPADEVDGASGRIRAFRDPGWFADPADGREYLLIAASVAGARGFDGAVGIAARRGRGWTLLPPLLVADGIHHELERPHVVAHRGRCYLFFSAHARTFHPPGRAPTGLYGFVAPAVLGPYEPLNGSGLVIANPPEQPHQAYAWLVLPDLRAVSFLDDRTSGDAAGWRPAGAREARARFDGTVAPALRLALDGARSAIVGVESLVASSGSSA
jgi:levansucrase